MKSERSITRLENDILNILTANIGFAYPAPTIRSQLTKAYNWSTKLTQKKVMLVLNDMTSNQLLLKRTAGRKVFYTVTDLGAI